MELVWSIEVFVARNRGMRGSKGRRNVEQSGSRTLRWRIFVEAQG